MLDKPPLYPAILTQAEWNKHKGIIAKVVKADTGIGAQLAQLQRDFDNLPWQYWFPQAGGKLPRLKTDDDIVARLKLAKQKGPTAIAGFRQDLIGVKTICSNLGDKWSRSKLVPDSTVKHVRIKMVNAIDQLDDQMADLEPHTPSYQLAYADAKRLNAFVIKNTQQAVADLEKHLPGTKKNPTVAFYNDGLHNGVRGVGVALSNLPKYKTLYQKDWENKAGDGYMAGVKDGQPVLAKVAEIEAALKRLKTALKDA